MKKNLKIVNISSFNNDDVINNNSTESNRLRATFDSYAVGIINNKEFIDKLDSENKYFYFDSIYLAFEALNNGLIKEEDLFALSSCDLNQMFPDLNVNISLFKDNNETSIKRQLSNKDFTFTFNKK